MEPGEEADCAAGIEVSPERMRVEIYQVGIAEISFSRENKCV